MGPAMLDEMTCSWSAEVSTVGTRCQGNRLETRDRDWFSTAKPGDEQISLNDPVERLTEGENDADETMRELSGTICFGGAVDPQGSWIYSCCPEVILHSAFSQCCSVSLHSFLPCV